MYQDHLQHHLVNMSQRPRVSKSPTLEPPSFCILPEFDIHDFRYFWVTLLWFYEPSLNISDVLRHHKKSPSWDFGLTTLWDTCIIYCQQILRIWFSKFQIVYNECYIVLSYHGISWYIIKVIWLPQVSFGLPPSGFVWEYGNPRFDAFSPFKKTKFVVSAHWKTHPSNSPNFWVYQRIPPILWDTFGNLLEVFGGICHLLIPNIPKSPFTTKLRKFATPADTARAAQASCETSTGHILSHDKNVSVSCRYGELI